MANESTDRFSRREFLTTAAALGAGAMLGCTKQLTKQDEESADGNAQAGPGGMPTHPFGKTGVQVPILALGGMFDTSSHLMLRQAISYGVTYWDTAFSYADGSEKGMGDFFAANPGERERIFLVTKSHERNAQGLTAQLTTSLERLQTDRVDLFFMHSVNAPGLLTHEVRKWVDSAKSEGKIRFFGFSTHENIAACLTGAAEVGWVDGIMMCYNYRLMHDDAMSAAVDACLDAGIGLTAMKTQGAGQHTSEDAAAELIAGLLAEGYTQHQAALKAIWAEGKIASICSQMPNSTFLAANVAAAMDKTALSDASMRRLAEYAAATKSDYCAACGRCQDALDNQVPVCDVMRYVMYHNSCGDKHRARELFAALPAKTRRKLTSVDYSAAERVCPQNVPIAERMKLACELLA